MQIYLEPHRKIIKIFASSTAIIFLACLIFLLYGLNRVEILIKPKLSQSQISFHSNISQETWPDAKFFEASKSLTKTFTPETPITIENFAEGEVTVINKTKNSQKLIATTRLLSTQKLLFRLIKTITVPANGQITAAVKADEPGSKYEIGPSSFTIPGLTKSLQKYIYAESEQKMRNGSRESGLLLLPEFEKNKKDMQTELENQYINEIKKEIGENFYLIPESDILKTQSDTTGDNEAVTSYSLIIESNIKVVALDKTKVSNIAKNYLEQGLSEEQKIYDCDESNIQLSLSQTSFAEKTSTLNGQIECNVGLSGLSKDLDKEKIKNLKSTEAKKYLESLPGIETATIRFSFPLMKTIPKNIEKINFIIL